MELLFYNGYGGFDPKQGEYVIDSRLPTPMPWVNCVTCVSGRPFGFVLSDAGGGFVWSGNSHENRLTPWLCQLVRDPVQERVTITEQDGTSFDAIPRFRADGDRVRFGKGYAVFERDKQGTDRKIMSKLTVYAAADAPVKCTELTLRTEQDTMLTVSYQVSLAGFLPGRLPGKRVSGGCTVQDRVFVLCDGTPRKVSWENNTVLMKLEVRLRAEEAATVCFYLGEGDGGNFLRGADLSLETVREEWERLLGRIRIATPEPSVDILMNGWLLYQVKSCRIDGRSGLYQSGGAYGFRDQLQDSLALLYTAPELTRMQILLHAGAQYEEGDVQHWWHPPGNHGIRTRCSDDFLWLVYASSEYIRVTDDWGILQEKIPFLRSPELKPEEKDRYEQPEKTEAMPLFEHLRRAIRRSMRFGPHGLPLLGSCDWNDGFSRAGAQGRGESVWLSWFLQDCLTRYLELSGREEPDNTEERSVLRKTLERLSEDTENNAWEEDRYLRAFCDDGTVLGSIRNAECRIDSIAQSWACISGRGDPARVTRALDTAVKYLADFENGIIKLLAPPFEKMKGVGYIASYPAGIRENGGQYTHAAIWLAKALLQSGNGDLGYAVMEAVNPVSHTRSALDVRRYRAEPYAVCADVYAASAENAVAGRAGWSWYTGSAAWFYRVILEDLLGFRIRTEKETQIVTLNPCLPSSWKSFEIAYRYGKSRYIFIVEPGASFEMKLEDDGKEHRIPVRRISEKNS